jgi:quercetin dioxygenase-like cupin family protein
MRRKERRKMAIRANHRYQPLTAHDNPDDYGPHAESACLVDPASAEGGVVRNLSVLLETGAPGDRVALRAHSSTEDVICIDEGTAAVRLGQATCLVGTGAMVFVPSGVAHGRHNVGARVLRLRDVFPSAMISLVALERNPAPGPKARHHSRCSHAIDATWPSRRCRMSMHSGVPINPDCRHQNRR